MENIRPIRTEADYDWGLAEVEAAFHLEPAPDSAEGQRLSVLLDLIEAYEARHRPIGDADPVETILYAMERSGRTRRDLSALLGSRSRASEILNRKRPLNLDQIRKLSRSWGIPAEALIADESAERAA